MENAALLNSILAHAPIGLAFFDREHRFVRVNRFLAEMNGVPVEHHLGRRLDEVLPENAPSVIPFITEVFETGSHIAETIVTGQTPLAPGVTRSWATGYFPVKDPKGQVLFVGVFAVEISELVSARKSAEESSGRLEAVLSGMTEGVLTADPEGNVFDWNPAALEMHGYSTLAEGRRHVSEFHALFELRYLDGTVVPLEEWPLAKALRGETFSGDELTLRRQDRTGERVISYSGSPVLDSSGNITLAVLTLQDVTERKNRESMLKESESRFRQLANSIPQLVWMARPDGEIFWYNERWYAYTGTTPDDVTGWGWKKIHDPDILPQVIRKWESSLGSGEPFEMEFPLRGQDGHYRWFLTRVEPVRDPSGNIVLWFGTNTDVQAKRDLAEEKQHLLESERAARVQAERVNRMKDEFLATLSHELRTPLNAIVGWSELLERKKYEDVRLMEGLSSIARNARAQAQLIEDLLDMSRITAGKLRLNLQEVNLASVVEGVIESVRPLAQDKGIQITKAVDCTSPMTLGDPARLEQIVWNLLVNAVKFTQRGGLIQVTVEVGDSSVEVHVSDNGQGIDPQFLPYIFERFRQADSSTTRSHGGLGLGLSLVRQLTELHGGTVRAKSRGLGEGATFIISLRHSNPQLSAVINDYDRGSSADDEADISLLGLTTLVVDDEQDSREIISRILEEAGATVVTAGSAIDALETLRRMQPDVLVSDIAMPGMDGYQLIHRVRSLPPEEGGKVPAAALTAHARSQDRRKALRAGFQTHVVKPVEPLELITVVASITKRTAG